MGLKFDQIDSGITFNNGITYLFQSDYYYKLNETAWVKSSPSYPRQTITLWFECRSRKKIIGNMTLRTKRPKTDAVTSNSTKQSPQHHQSNDDDGDEHPQIDIFIIFCVLLFIYEIGLVVTIYIWDEKMTKKDSNLNLIEKASKTRKEQIIGEETKDEQTADEQNENNKLQRANSRFKMNLLIPGN